MRDFAICGPGVGPVVDRLKALPKVDLHRHLEGSLRLATLCEIAREHDLHLPGCELGSLRPLVQFGNESPNFRGFLARFEVLRRFYSTREAIERVAREAVLDAAADNVRYLELRFSPLSIAESQQFPLEEVVERVISGVAQARQRVQIEVRLLMTIVRGSDVVTARRIVDLAAAYRDHGVVGVDLAGDEVSHPSLPFAPVFLKAAELSLGRTVHAGEVTGPESIRAAIQALHAERIGHGVRAREDGAVIDLIRRSDVTLEMCLTSNLQTGAVAQLRHHPLTAYLQAGLRVTVNTDNPSVSNTTLTDEFRIAVSELDVTEEQLATMILNGVRAAFLPDDEKKELEQWFRQEITTTLSSLPGDSAAANPKSR